MTVFVDIDSTLIKTTGDIQQPVADIVEHVRRLKKGDHPLLLEYRRR